MRPAPIALASIVLLSHIASAAEDSRTWTGRNGDKTEATFVRESGGIIFLRTADGREIKTRQKLLSERDLRYLDLLRRESRVGVSKPTAKTKRKFGLSENERKKVYRELGEAEDRADAEVQAMHPFPNPLDPAYSAARSKAQLQKQIQALGPLTKKYRAEVAQRHGITEKALRAITVEGFQENWSPQ